jgi:putative inorganic carbon (hco3(-)) transporter
MRQVIVTFLCGIVAAVGVPFPQVALFGWIWFGLMRPDYVSFSPGKLNYSMWIAVALLLGGVRYLKNAPSSWFQNPMSRLLVIMVVPLFFSVQFAAFREDADDVLLLFVRNTIAVLMVPLLITTVKELKTLYLVMGMSLGAHGFWRGFAGLLHGGARMNGGIGGFMSDNNTFACGLVMVLPFMWYSRVMAKTAWLRFVLLLMVCGSMATIVWTFSRGGALGLAAVLILFIKESRQKLAAVMILIVLGLAPVVYLVHDSYMARMSTTVNYEDDTSALSRIVLMKAAPRIWAMRPWFGVGLGDRNFFMYSSQVIPEEYAQNIVIHNSYLQMLVQAGIFAFVIFNYMLLSTLGRVWRAAGKMKREWPELEAFPRAIQFSLVGYMVCSLTQPRATFDLFYLVIAVAAAWHNVSGNLPRPEAANRPQASTQLSPYGSVAALPART